MTGEVARLPAFNLALGAVADIGARGAAESDLPQLNRNYLTVAELVLGGGEYIRPRYEPQTVYLSKVVYQQHAGHQDLMERARRHAVIGPANFVLMAADLEWTDIYPSVPPGVIAVAPLVTQPQHGLGSSISRMVGRHGNLLWINLDEDVPPEDELTWTPFDKNEGIASSQFEITPDIGRVTLSGHAVGSKTRIRGPDIIYTDPDGNMQRTIEEEPVAEEDLTAKRKSLADRVHGLMAHGKR